MFEIIAIILIICYIVTWIGIEIMNKKEEQNQIEEFKKIYKTKKEK